MKRKNKHNNKKILIDGILFDSTKEGKRYLVLKSMLKRGEISNLQLQPKFLLLKGFRYYGKKIQDITYKADFRYIRKSDNLDIIEDVKGYKTETYTLRKKLLLDKVKEDKSVLFIET